jgi:hypothetical protein
MFKNQELAEKASKSIKLHIIDDAHQEKRKEALTKQELDYKSMTGIIFDNCLCHLLNFQG